MGRVEFCLLSSKKNVFNEMTEMSFHNNSLNSLPLYNLYEFEANASGVKLPVKNNDSGILKLVNLNSELYQCEYTSGPSLFSVLFD